ncbi:MAG: rod shape-determining protein MreC [Herpetosiphon sp.]
MRSSITAVKQGRSVSRRALSAALVVMIVAALLIPLDRAGLLDRAKGPLQAILMPTQRLLTNARLNVSSWSDDLLHWSTLRRRNGELEATVADLRRQVIQLQTLQSRNDALERELGIRQVYGWHMVSASVIQSTSSAGRRMIRIGKGKLDGVSVGMAVVAKEGSSPPSLVGVVDRSYAQTADVLLITDGTFSLAARTTSRTPAIGLLVGQWQVGSRTRLEEVDRDATIASGDVVVSAGLSKPVSNDTPLAQIPANVPIGVVEQVSGSNYAKSAEVRPFIDPDRVRDLWVVTGEDPK